MALEDTPLTQEIDAITQQGPTPVHYQWRGEVLANGQKIDALKILSIDINRDFARSYADDIVVECVFGAGTFNIDIFPYKNDLTVTLYREPLGEVGTDSDLSKDIDAQPLRAKLIKSSSAAIEGNLAQSQDREAMNLTDLVYVSFQLIDLALEQIRMQSVGTVFRNVTSSEALRYFLTYVSSLIQVDDVHRIKGVDMVDSPNSTPQDHIPIRQGTRFIEVPELLDRSASGIYPSGFGYYLQQNYWFIYPLYDLTRFDNAKQTITLINVPKNRYPQIERTYRQTGNQLIALVTGGVRHRDESEAMQLNQGNGVRFAMAGQMIGDNAQVADNKAIVKRALNNSELISQPRPDGLNNVMTSSNPITSNVFRELSKLAKRNGSYLQVKWENSDFGLIRPGMGAKYMYTVKDQVVEVKGVVVAAHTYVATDVPGLTSARHITNTVLTLFVDRNIDWSAIEGTTPAAPSNS